MSDVLVDALGCIRSGVRVIRHGFKNLRLQFLESLPWSSICLAAFFAAVLVNSIWHIPSMKLNGIEIHLMDVVSVVVALYTGAIFLRTRKVSPAFLVLIFLAAVAIVRGLSVFGMQEAGNAFRWFFYLLIAIWFSQTCLNAESRDVVVRLWKWSAIMFSLWAMAFFVREGFGTYASTDSRALAAPHAFIVTHAALMTAQRVRTKWDQLALVLFLFTLVNSQQRTVWASSLVAFVALGFTAGTLISPRARLRIGQSILLVCLAQTLIFVAPSVWREEADVQVTSTPTESIVGTGAGEQLTQSSTSALDSFVAAGDSGTFGWRIEGIQILLSEFDDWGFVDRVIGQPMGGGFDRIMNGVLVQVSPHNMYVNVLLSFGIFGLACLLWVFFSALHSARKIDPSLFAIILSLLVFSFGYELFPEHGIFVGLGLALRSPANRWREIR